MDKRIKLGIPFHYYDNWIAGTYYIVNLINALNLLHNSKKPMLIIFYNNDDGLNLLEKIDYPYIQFEKEKSVLDYNLFQLILNKLSRRTLKKNIFENRPKYNDLDALFPTHYSYYLELIPNYKKIFWLPDLQEHFLPEFFKKEEINARKNKQKELILNKANIFFSSNSSLKDFNDIYSKNKNKKSVVQFVVFHKENYKKIPINKLLKKYNLPRKYFICSNQFWAHKNHITLLRAVKLLKQKYLDFHIVFTGNITDYRNPNFYKTLLNFVDKENLNEYVSFLGFINRDEQLKLMSKSIAIIQPSLFEGWSTVVEDAKSMSKHIILSDLRVHKEQCQKNVTFFKRKNEKELSNIILNFIKNPPKTDSFDYKKDQIKFAKTFMDSIQELINKKTS